MEHKRFFLAILLSAAILFVWSYFAPQPPPTDGPQNPSAQASPSPQATVENTSTSPPQQLINNLGPQDSTPPRIVTVVTPLYEVKLDSRGAVATSWILRMNRESNRPFYSVGGTRNSPMPLELISPRGLQQTPREAPLRIITPDDNLNLTLDNRNYQVRNVEGETGDVRIELGAGEQRYLEFLLQDEATGLSVTKRITFNANTYNVDLQTRVARGDQIVPNLRLAVGPSIGDQGIEHYTFYSVAPEGVAAAGDQVPRVYSATVHENEQSPGRERIAGEVSWAGVADTYFAMVAVPSRVAEGLEFRVSKYEHEHEGQREDRFLITSLVPIPSDGASTILYVGPKDHDILTTVSGELNRLVERPADRRIDLHGLIDYGFGSFISEPLVSPILWSIKRLYALTHSYGLSIILFTIIIYSLFFPLKWRSSVAMKKAQRYAPQMKEIQEKIKGMKPNDPRLKELQMEQLRLMKTANPLGGCLPLLIQMPFFFALFRAITVSVDFRQADFLWLPDLSAADPYHLLPVLMAASMLVLQLITPAPSADPLQRKMMAVVLPAVMLYAMWSAPSGLLVYWLVGNLVLFGQQMLINRLIKSEDDQPPPEEKAESNRAPKNLKPRVSQA
jgi:YidC/Oxa1 family membrane protein insertase